MLNTVQNKGEKLHSSMLSYRQKNDFINTVIVPSATYAFPLAYLTRTDLRKLDKVYAKICKQALGLPSSCPTAMVFEDRNRGGAGMPSLQVEYSKMVTDWLVESLLDTGQLGIVTQALMRLQHSVISNALKDKHAKVAKRQVAHYHLARKLAYNKQISNYACLYMTTHLPAICFAKK